MFIIIIIIIGIIRYYCSKAYCGDRDGDDEDEDEDDDDDDDDDHDDNHKGWHS